MATPAEISARIDVIDDLISRGERVTRDESGNSVEIDLQELRKERQYLKDQQLANSGQSNFRRVVFTDG